MRPIPALIPVLLVGCGEPTAPAPSPPSTLASGLEVVASAPVAGAVGVARAAMVTLEFSLPVNPTTVNDQTVTLWREADRVPASLSSNGATAVLVPRTLLELNTTYVVTATRAVQDTAGRPMVREFRLVFTTKVNGGR